MIIATNEFEERLDKKVPIVNGYRLGKQIPFGEKILGDPIDVILSFYGSMDEVYNMT